MAEETTAADEAPRSFCRMLAALAEEQAEHDLTNEMHGLIKKLRLDARSKGPDGKSSGDLTLKVKFSVDYGGHASVGYTVAVKEPPKRRPQSMLYVTNGGNLVAENPRQQKLPLRDVSAEKTETREVDGAVAAREV